MRDTTPATRIRRLLALVAAPVLLAAVSGCATSGAFNAANLTNVELSSDNYRIVATDVDGEATAGYLLGASIGTASRVQTAAIARVSGSGALYRDAMADLWRSFASEHGPVEGRNLALVNVRIDTDALNLLLYTRARLGIRADVVEFDGS